MVVVDFWAPWCAPCKALAPVLEQLAQANPDVAIVKVNVDNSRILAVDHGIRSIPTLLFFKDGQAASTRLAGMQSLDKLQALVDTLKAP